MANLLLQVSSNLRTFALSASSNGSPPGAPQSGGPVILELSLDKIRRPLMRTRANDPQKVKELMDSISEIGLQVPASRWYLRIKADNIRMPFLNGRVHLVTQKIDVLEVDGVYYGFSGCHRYEAHQRLGLKTIRCKVRRGTKETLRHHLR